MTIDLNNKKSIPTVDLRDVNQDKWVERYRNAPPISPEGCKPSGGTGFIDADRYANDPIGLTDKLLERSKEVANAHGPDKDRLKLLYNAEQTYAYASPGEAREALGKLMQYDHDHGHPIADSKRDLNQHPYTPQEQNTWHRRDGRELTSQEGDVFHKLGWDEKQTEAPKPSNDPDWHIHEAVKPLVEREHSRIAREQELDRQLELGAKIDVGGVNVDSIRARRGLSQ
ncbi:hypothetical protein [Pseudoxanthomonas winnipegensis]|uniref:hypothetical protein n=1 Tax=Pseudoxanthomonas winnipegensis TaxID=2480810 RepID=UPI00103998AF|nr:hypothetical protein [Pseudoxanthomonas winnipegensis]TBV69362.1 hypothetical protein EYC45_19560 [Pseudoxanthomonas winnipegensis]